MTWLYACSALPQGAGKYLIEVTWGREDLLWAHDWGEGTVHHGRNSMAGLRCEAVGSGFGGQSIVVGTAWQD